MSNNDKIGQPLENVPPPANAVEEEHPVVDPGIDDGYEADDEGSAGGPQDPFFEYDDMFVITEEEAEERADEAQVEPDQNGNAENNN